MTGIFMHFKIAMFHLFTQSIFGMVHWFYIHVKEQLASFYTHSISQHNSKQRSRKSVIRGRPKIVLARPLYCTIKYLYFFLLLMCLYDFLHLAWILRIDVFFYFLNGCGPELVVALLYSHISADLRVKEHILLWVANMALSRKKLAAGGGAAL